MSFDEFDVGADHDGAMDIMCGKCCQSKDVGSSQTLAELIAWAEQHKCPPIVARTAVAP